MAAHTYMSSHCNLCYDGLRNMNGLRNGARRASRNVTVHRPSAYSQDLLFTAPAVCIKPKERKHVAHTIHVLIVPSCVVFSHSTRTGLHFAQGSGARLLYSDSRHNIMTSSDELLARIVSLDDERHQRVYSGQLDVVHRLSC